MKYIVVTAQNGRSYYLAKSRIGGGYTTIATFQNELMARETADLLNNRFETPNLVPTSKPMLMKGGRQ